MHLPGSLQPWLGRLLPLSYGLGLSLDHLLNHGFCMHPLTSCSQGFWVLDRPGQLSIDLQQSHGPQPTSVAKSTESECCLLQALLHGNSH